MRRQPLLRQRHHLALPAGLRADAPHPLGQRKRRLLADVVDPSRGARVRRRAGNRSGHILDVAACPAPAGGVLAQQNRRAAVVHALEICEEAVLVVAWTIHHRQAQDRAGKVPRAQVRTLDQDLVVVVGPVARIVRRQGRLAAIREQLFAQRRIFRERQRVGHARLGADQPAVGTIDVLAADGDDPPRGAAEDRDHGACLRRGHRVHVQDYVGHEPGELRAMQGQLAAVTGRDETA